MVFCILLLRLRNEIGNEIVVKLPFTALLALRLLRLLLLRLLLLCLLLLRKPSDRCFSHINHTPREGLSAACGNEIQSLSISFHCLAGFMEIDLEWLEAQLATQLGIYTTFCFLLLRLRIEN